IAEEADDLLRFARAHQPGIDIDAGQLIADRLMDEDGGHRAVDAARKAADDLAAADLAANARNRLILEGGHRPVAFEAADLMYKVGKQPRARRGMHNLGMELHAVEAARLIRDGGERRAF